MKQYVQWFENVLLQSASASKSGTDHFNTFPTMPWYNWLGIVGIWGLTLISETRVTIIRTSSNNRSNEKFNCFLISKWFCFPQIASLYAYIFPIYGTMNVVHIMWWMWYMVSFLSRDVAETETGIEYVASLYETYERVNSSQVVEECSSDCLRMAPSRLQG